MILSGGAVKLVPAIDVEGFVTAIAADFLTVQQVFTTPVVTDC
jgi:hypothetical protein